MRTRDFVAVNEETREPNDRGVCVDLETWGGVPLVRIDVGAFDLPQHHGHVFVTAETFTALGRRLLALGGECGYEDAARAAVLAEREACEQIVSLVAIVPGESPEAMRRRIWDEIHARK